jgi:hypothetical protein
MSLRGGVSKVPVASVDQTQVFHSGYRRFEGLFFVKKM